MQGIEDIPTWLSTAWGIDVAAAQIIMTVSVIFALILPVIILRKERSSFNVEIIMALLGMILCVGLGWLNYWVLIVTIVIIALFAAVKLGGTFGGD